jgi:hypothetical protein
VDITCVTLDCADHGAQARFWSEALRWPDVHVGRYGASVRPAGGGTYLELVVVPEGKVSKNRMHLGCTAGELEQLDAEIERLTALGATFGWEEDFPPDVAARYRNVILRDPEGNEFCLGAGRWEA